jgi:hypothetical protein
MNDLRAWGWLLGGLCLAGAWLAGSFSASVVGAWNPPALVCLGLASVCWGATGWIGAREDGATYEGRAFYAAILALAPWLVFPLLIIAPFALGVRQSPI